MAAQPHSPGTYTCSPRPRCAVSLIPPPFSRAALSPALPPLSQVIFRNVNKLLVDTATGQPTGSTTKLGQAVMVLTALCRQQQLLRDQRGE